MNQTVAADAVDAVGRNIHQGIWLGIVLQISTGTKKQRTYANSYRAKFKTIYLSSSLNFHEQSIMTDLQPIFCCEHVNIGKEIKTYKDPYSEHHYALYRSFLAFAQRRQRAWSLMRVIRDADSRPLVPLPPDTLPSLSPTMLPHPVLTPAALENNPITLDTQYVIHVVSRHDFGPVMSHRYFACPANLDHDWEEATLVQWFANGEPFKLKAHKWDFKCLVDSVFYRLVVRPNLALRSMPPGISNG